MLSVNDNPWRFWGSILTEGQPGLSNLQVDCEICLEAQILDSHISAGLSFQGRVLHVAMEDT